MNKPDGNPASEDILRDQRAAFDKMRESCPVAKSGDAKWTLFRHEDISRVLSDHHTFSNVVSKHLNIPDGMDPPDHTEYRRIIEPYFNAGRMKVFEPECRRISIELVQSVLDQGNVEFIGLFAELFAVRIQCAFLGWPLDMWEPLIQWSQKNRAAIRLKDRTAMQDIAREFSDYIKALLQTRRESSATSSADVTAGLMHDRVWGRLLTEEEIVGILRNWTAGEIGTIAASIGILAHFLAEHSDIQTRLRGNPSEQHAAIEEILRLHGPLLSNRRVTTCPVEIGGQNISAGDEVTLNWVSANRDEHAFVDAHTFNHDRNQSRNLLYGLGIHVCPGAPLARLELQVVLEELLRRTVSIQFNPDAAPTHAVSPVSGYETLPLIIR